MLYYWILNRIAEIFDSIDKKLNTVTLVVLLIAEQIMVLGILTELSGTRIIIFYELIILGGILLLPSPYPMTYPSTQNKGSAICFAAAFIPLWTIGLNPFSAISMVIYGFFMLPGIIELLDWIELLLNPNQNPNEEP